MRCLPASAAFVPVIAVCLAACAGSATLAEDACGASRFQHLVGESEAALATVTLPDLTRIIGPGDAVTMDFSAERLNVVLSEDRLVQRIYCG